MRVLALIPARAGSKRLPGKNKKILGNKPLISWTIQASKGIEGICDILVSTDDPSIQKIAKSSGAKAPWLRPKKLSSDTASSVKVALHALRWYEKAVGKVDGILLLQPTSPFRTKKRIRFALKKFSEDPQTPIVSVAKMHPHPLWSFKMKGKYGYPFFKGRAFCRNSQELPEAYGLDGSIYLCSVSQLKKTRSFFGHKIFPYVTHTFKEALEIDEIEDFKLAQKLLGKK